MPACLLYAMFTPRHFRLMVRFAAATLLFTPLMPRLRFCTPYALRRQYHGAAMLRRYDCCRQGHSLHTVTPLFDALMLAVARHYSPMRATPFSMAASAIPIYADDICYDVVDMPRECRRRFDCFCRR